MFTEIELDRSRNTLMIGTNGVGKSTFIDAMCFALYGKPFRKIVKAKIVNSINEKDCLVELEFTVNRKRYLVRRGIKPNLFEIFRDGVLLDKDPAMSDYQEVLDGIICKNYKAFTHIDVLSSAAFEPFMQLNAADRRQVIEDILDIQVFSQMSAILKQKASANKSSLETVRIQIAAKEESINFASKTVAKFKTNNEDAINKLVSQEARLQLELNTITANIVLLEKELGPENPETIYTKHFHDSKKEKQRLSKLTNLRGQIEANRARIIEENQFFDDNDNCPTCKQSIDQSFKASHVLENFEKLKEIKQGLDKLDDEIEKCENNITVMEEAYKNYASRCGLLQSRKEQRDGLVKNIADIRASIDSFESTQDTEGAKVDIDSLKQELEELQQEKAELLEEKQYIDAATLILKDSGIRSKVIKQYLPIINNSINKYLSKLGFFVNFQLNEEFEETIKSRYRDEFSYYNFSEGQKKRIDLAILLAWRDIAKSRNSTSTNILILDDNTHVFVISHRDNMVERFERTIKFELNKNFSMISKGLD
jgi:DNA repair exonuclease SbcCD ATPase subunit